MFNLFNQPKYRMGLALSGGGARGFAHVGAVRAFEEFGIRPDIIAGVSAGSVVAVFYAAGVPLDEMVEMFEQLSFTDLCELSVPKDGFFSLDKFRKFLKANIPYKNIEDLPIPTVVCATDIDKCKPVAFDRGPIAECVVASCTIPIVFKPAVIHGTHYVDGGVLHNLPAWAIREQCRYLLGVNVSPLVNGRYKGTLMDIARRSYRLLAKNNAIPDMEMCDLVINTTDIAEHKVFDLKEIHKVLQGGYKNTMAELLANGFKPVAELRNTRKSGKFKLIKSDNKK